MHIVDSHSVQYSSSPNIFLRNHGQVRHPRTNRGRIVRSGSESETQGIPYVHIRNMRGQQLHSEQLVAIKKLKRLASCQADAMRNSATREIRVLNLLSHEHIVRLIEVIKRYVVLCCILSSPICSETTASVWYSSTWR